MSIEMFKSKIHRAVVTDADLHYEGSVTIDRELMDRANIYEHERVQVLDINNGERFETYVIEGERGAGTICLNGAAARRVQKGDLTIIISYQQIPESEIDDHDPIVVQVDENNQPV